MEITPASQTQAAAARRTAAAAEETAAGAAAVPGGDFQTFLTLLTTQLQNQDPLKPMESTEFVSQLASFSAVEQQVRTNDRLDEIFAALSGGASAGLADWIGKEVRAPAQANYTGVPIQVETTPLDGADTAVLVVKDDFGKVVAQRAVDAEAERVTWDGKDALGNALPNGLYSFAVESYAGEELLGTTPGQVYAEVTEVRIEGGEPVLVLKGGGKAKLEDVSAVR